MKTQDFIRDIVSGYRTKEGGCSSVYFDGKHIYSYGRHYPLLVNVNGKWILNDSGYSVTTARHISWARPYADYVASFNETTNPEEIKKAASNEYNEATRELGKTRLSAFRKRERLNNRTDELLRTITFLIG